VRSKREIGPAELLAEVRRLGLRTSADWAAIIRVDRDGHQGGRFRARRPAFRGAGSGGDCRAAGGRPIGRAFPLLLDFELANYLPDQDAAAANQRDVLRAAFGLAHRLSVETVAVDHAAALDLAEATGLTAYDASYLWLSRALGAELVTLDGKLAAANRTRRNSTRCSLR
jgi:predicted nucleic acid-binding protein